MPSPNRLKDLFLDGIPALGTLVNAGDASTIECLETAGLDTITSEHPTPDMPIFSCENAILTPHAAWYSDECNRDLLVEAARNCADSLLGKPMGTLCNPELLK